MRSGGKVKWVNSLIFALIFRSCYQKNVYLKSRPFDVLIATCYDRHVKMSRWPDNVNNEEETYCAPFASRSAPAPVDMFDR